MKRTKPIRGLPKLLVFPDHGFGGVRGNPGAVKPKRGGPKPGLGASSLASLGLGSPNLSVMSLLLGSRSRRTSSGFARLGLRSLSPGLPTSCLSTWTWTNTRTSILEINEWEHLFNLHKHVHIDNNSQWQPRPYLSHCHAGPC